MAKNLTKSTTDPVKQYKVKSPYTFLFMAGGRVVRAVKRGEVVEASEKQVQGQLHKLIPLEEQVEAPAPAPKEDDKPVQEELPPVTPVEEMVQNNDPKEDEPKVVKKSAKAKVNKV